MAGIILQGRKSLVLGALTVMVFGALGGAARGARHAALVAVPVEFINAPASPISSPTFFFVRVGVPAEEVKQVRFFVRNQTREWGYLGDYVPELRLYKFFWNVQQFANDSYAISAAAQVGDSASGNAQLFVALRKNTLEPPAAQPAGIPPGAIPAQPAALPAPPAAPSVPAPAAVLALPDIRILEPRDGSAHQTAPRFLGESTRPLESLEFWLDNPGTEARPDLTLAGTPLDDSHLRWEHLPTATPWPAGTYTVIARGRYQGVQHVSRQGVTLTMASPSALALTPLTVTFHNPPSSPLTDSKYLFVRVGAPFSEISAVAFRVTGREREQTFVGEAIPDLELHKFYWNIGDAPPGSYKITATAETAGGSRGSAELFLVVLEGPAAAPRPPETSAAASVGTVQASHAKVTWLQPGPGAVLRETATLAARVDGADGAVQSAWFQYTGPATGEVPAESVGGGIWLARWPVPTVVGPYQLIAIVQLGQATRSSDPIEVAVAAELPDKAAPERPLPPPAATERGEQSGAAPRPPEAPPAQTNGPAPAKEPPVPPPPGEFSSIALRGEPSGTATKPVAAPPTAAGPQERSPDQPAAAVPTGGRPESLPVTAQEPPARSALPTVAASPPAAVIAAPTPNLELDPRCRARGITDGDICRRELAQLTEAATRVPADCQGAGILQPEACRRFRFQQALRSGRPAPPPECQARGLEGDACKTMFLQDNLPLDCRDQGLTEPERCARYLEHVDLPHACRQQGVTERPACEAWLKERYVIPRCQTAGISDPAACDAHVRQQAAAVVTCGTPAGVGCPAAVIERHATEVVAARAQIEQVAALVPAQGNTAILLQPPAQRPAEAGSKTIERLAPVVVAQPLPAQLMASKPAVVVLADGTVAVAAPAVMALDQDGDGLPDEMEERLGSQIAVADSDGDGVSDRDEAAAGTNPAGGGSLTTPLAPVEMAVANRRPLEQPIALPQAAPVLAVTLVASVPPSPGAAAPSVPSLHIAGRGHPGEVVTLFIYSPLPLVVTTRVNADGTWRYTLRQSLADGPHEVYVAVNDATGKIVARSEPKNFLVRAAFAVSPTELFPPAAPPPAAPAFQLARIYLPLAGVVVLAGMLGFGLVMRRRHRGFSGLGR